MADDIEIKVTGLSELQAALEKLGKDEGRAIVREGLKAGGTAMQEAMMEMSSSAVHGEPGVFLSQKSSWSRSVRMTRGDELAGVTRVRPKGSLPETHTALGIGMQKKGTKYHRSLIYLVKLLEFGPSGGLPRGQGKFPVMTAGFESNQDKFLARVINVIRDRLKL